MKGQSMSGNGSAGAAELMGKARSPGESLTVMRVDVASASVGEF